MSFAGERAVKAVRKRHRCDGCGAHIEIGEPAMRWAGLTDGDFGTAIYHPECRDAETAWNVDLLDYRWGDDWYPLAEIDDEDRPWLLEAYPIVAQRMGLLNPAVTGVPDGAPTRHTGLPEEEPPPMTPTRQDERTG